MKADVSLSQLWFNQSLLSFFFRNQARETLDEIISAAGGKNNPDAFQELENAIEDHYDSLGDFEEDCYNASLEEMLDTLDL